MQPANQVEWPTPEWYEVRARLFRFFGTHPGWARWQDPQSPHPTAWICGQDRMRQDQLARPTRVAAILKDLRLIHSRAMPEQHAYADITPAGWNRMFSGVFVYLMGPALLDDAASIACALLRMPGASKMATGAPIPFPEASSEQVAEHSGAQHIGLEQMDALFEQSLSAPDRAALLAHLEVCPFCARQVAAYQGAAAQIGAPIERPKHA